MYVKCNLRFPFCPVINLNPVSFAFTLGKHHPLHWVRLKRSLRLFLFTPRHCSISLRRRVNEGRCVYGRTSERRCLAVCRCPRSLNNHNYSSAVPFCWNSETVGISEAQPRDINTYRGSAKAVPLTRHEGAWRERSIAPTHSRLRQ
jgi:hypothetical protein